MRHVSWSSLLPGLAAVAAAVVVRCGAAAPAGAGEAAGEKAEEDGFAPSFAGVVRGERFLFGMGVALETDRDPETAQGGIVYEIADRSETSVRVTVERFITQSDGRKKVEKRKPEYRFDATRPADRTHYFSMLFVNRPDLYTIEKIALSDDKPGTRKMTVPGLGNREVSCTVHRGTLTVDGPGGGGPEEWPIELYRHAEVPVFGLAGFAWTMRRAGETYHYSVFYAGREAAPAREP